MVRTDRSLSATHLLCAVGRYQEACSQVRFLFIPALYFSCHFLDSFMFSWIFMPVFFFLSLLINIYYFFYNYIKQIIIFNRVLNQWLNQQIICWTGKNCFSSFMASPVLITIQSILFYIDLILVQPLLNYKH